MKLQFKHKEYQAEIDYGTEAFRNAPLMLDEAQLLENIQKIQRRRNLPQSKSLVVSPPRQGDPVVLPRGQ